MTPEVVTRKRRIPERRISHKAAGCVCIQGEQEGYEKMMGVPKCLKGLLPYPIVGSGVHHQHTEQHDMSCNAANLSVMDLYGSYGPDLRPFDIEEA